MGDYYYAHIEGYELLTRRDLVPNEPDHKLFPTIGSASTYLHCKKGHTPQAMQLALLKTVQSYLPADSQVILLGDGEFDCCQVLDWLNRQPNWRMSAARPRIRGSNFRASGSVWTS